MSNRVNHTKGLDLLAVAPSQRAGRTVRWAADMRPALAPDVEGVVFLSTKKREVFVTWVGTSRPVLVFAGALVTA